MSMVGLFTYAVPLYPSNNPQHKLAGKFKVAFLNRLPRAPSLNNPKVTDVHFSSKKKKKNPPTHTQGWESLFV